MLIRSIVLSLALFSPEGFAKINKNPNQQVQCLATAIYYEARGEPDLGKKSVGHVIMNRTKSGKYPNDVCSVILQKKQFSFVKNRKNLLTPPNNPAYNKILVMAEEIFHNHEVLVDPTNNALYFHANYVRPNWKKQIKFKIGNHVFK